jgi:DNA-binding response OmpR family regulator
MARILVVDDSELLLAILEDELGGAGYTVATASTFEQLMTHLDREVFDLILLDMHMPDMSGEAVAQDLRNNRGITARLYLLSGMSESELAARVTSAGLDGYISKELGMDHLVARVREILG